MNKLIVISHDTRCDGGGELDGMLFSNMEKARKFIKREGYYSEEFGWNKEGDEYCDEENHICLLERVVDELNEE